MFLRILFFWIFVIQFSGNCENNLSESLEEILPTLLNPKLIFNFLKNTTTLINQWRNVALSNTKNIDLNNDNRSEKSEYIQGYALKFPKKYKKHEFQSEEESNAISTDEGRSKRGVVHLANMISCATGCNPVGYKGYGCYCGFLGSGYPVDGIDRCCKQHDWCYDVARCPMYLEYFVPYYWKCWYNRPYCAIEHGEFGGPGSCAGRLCECDRKLSMCLKQYRCPNKRAFCKSSPFRLFQNVFMLLTPR